MRIPTRKTLGTLLTLLALAGCMPLTTPVAPREGGLTVSIRMPQGYQTQYMVSDISRLVIGLVDVAAAESAYLGYEGTTKAAAPGYHPGIAGTDGGGFHTPGLLDFSATTGLSTAQKVDYNRYLYKTVTAGIGSSASATFSNIKAGTGRYIAFAAAYTGAGLTASDAIGFAQSAPFTVSGNETGTRANTAPPLTLNLNRRMGGIEVALSFDETTNAKKLVTTDKYVVTLVDGDSSRTPYFGYEGSTPLSADPPYHDGITNATTGLLDYGAMPALLVGDRGLRSRMMYFTAFQNGFTDPATSRTVRFTNLKPGNNYFVHAVAFTDGDGDGVNEATEHNGEVQSAPLSVTAGATASAALTLILE